MIRKEKGREGGEEVGGLFCSKNEVRPKVVQKEPGQEDKYKTNTRQVGGDQP